LSRAGRVTLTGCTLTNHVVQGGNAGQDLTNPPGNTGKGGNAMGAAIYSIGGTLNLTNCIVSGNAATAGEGSPLGPAGSCRVRAEVVERQG